MGRSYKLKKYDDSLSLRDNILKDRYEIAKVYNKTMDDLSTDKLFNTDVFVSKVMGCIKNDTKVGILVDADSDGINSAMVLREGLLGAGVKLVHSIICERSRGYGVLKEYYDEFKTIGVDFVITADIGISNKEEIEYGDSLEIETIITDHHEILNPPSSVYINPKDSRNTYKTPLCGCGVAYMLLKDLYRELDKEFDKDLIMLHHTTIATIGDMVPLIKDNYILVKEGLRTFENTNSASLRWLIDHSLYNDTNFSSTDVSFGIVPLINSLNRVSNPYKGLDFLSCQTYPELNVLGEYLVDRNNVRKKYQMSSVINCEKYIHKNDMENDDFMILNFGAKKSICGLVASFISADKYGVPSMVVSESSDGKTIAGSMRSTPNFDLIPMIKSISKHCIQIGGHPQAGGLSFKTEKLNDVKEAVNSYVSSHMDKLDYDVYIDKSIKIGDITDEFIDELYSIEPYGQGNPVPIFCSTNVQIADINCYKHNTFFVFEEVGDDMWSQSNVSIKGSSFKRDYSIDFNMGDIVSILYTVNKNKDIIVMNIKHM